jgi:hypothetical protein
LLFYIIKGLSPKKGGNTYFFLKDLFIETSSLFVFVTSQIRQQKLHFKKTSIPYYKSELNIEGFLYYEDLLPSSNLPASTVGYRLIYLPRLQTPAAQ